MISQWANLCAVRTDSKDSHQRQLEVSYVLFRWDIYQSLYLTIRQLESCIVSVKYIFVVGFLFYGTIAIIIIGVVFNLISLAILLTRRMRKVPANNYLIALAVYDIFVLLLNFAVGVARAQIPVVNEFFQRNEWICRLHAVVVDLFSVLSIWMIVSFSLERCLTVFLPLKAQRISGVRKARVLIIVVSLIMLLFASQKIFVTGFEGDSVFGYKACRTQRLVLPQIVLINVAVSTWAPLCIITGTNLALVIKVKSTERLRRRIFSRECHPNMREAAITRTLLAVSLAYVILVLPLGILQSMEMVHNMNRPDDGDPSYILYIHRKDLLKLIRSFCFCIYQLNFAVNFLLYLASNGTFRKQLRAVCRGKQITKERYFHQLTTSLKQHRSMESMRHCNSRSSVTCISSVNSL